MVLEFVFIYILIIHFLADFGLQTHEQAVGKGKNRKERANDKYYEGIRNTDGAIFVKLCDRIANVQYSKMTKSRMFEMYKKENMEFLKGLGCNVYNDCAFADMVKYLINLFND